MSGSPSTHPTPRSTDGAWRRQRIGWNVLGLYLSLALLSCSVSPEAEDSLNILIIVVDTLRADRMSLYGYHRPTTPYISRLAEHALVVDGAISHSPWTLPSMATLFTSTYESVHQLSMHPTKNSVSSLSPDFMTMAEYFRERGYRTAAITTQPWVSPDTGFG